jgi:O-methyltransferase
MAATNALAPTIDDTKIWDTFLSQFRLPIVNVAIDAGVFRVLCEKVLTHEELAEELGVDARALQMWLAALAADGFVEKRLGKWRATATARTWLHPEGKGYWGGFLKSIDSHADLNERLAIALKTGLRREGSAPRPVNWEAGTMPQEVADGIASFMQAHSQGPALGTARMPVFGELKCLMDVGCGSGIYGIEIAKANPDLQVVLMDLKEVATAAARYVEKAGMEARVSTAGVNMFEESWPSGPDGHLFCNVFHDWSFETNRKLAKNSFEALPSGGRIFLHEILIDDDYTGPWPAAAFSIMMLIGTLGQQFSLAEFKDILESAGFVDVQSERTGGGYYSLVSARKP